MKMDAQKTVNKVLDKDINSLLLIIFGFVTIGFVGVSAYGLKEMIELQIKNQKLLVEIKEKQYQILYKRCKSTVKRYCGSKYD